MNFADTIWNAVIGVVISASSVPARRSSARVRIVSSGTMKSTGTQNTERKFAIGEFSLATRPASTSASKYINAMNAENRNAAMYVDGDMNSCQICWRTRIPNLLIVSPCLFPRPFSTFREGRAVVPSCGGSPP